MEKDIKEEQVLDFKALSMTKGVFRQCRQIEVKEYTEYIWLENIQPIEVQNWLGYVIETWDSSVGEIQTDWFIFKLHGTMVRISDRELFWALRPLNDTPEQLRKLLPQIFVK